MPTPESERVDKHRRQHFDQIAVLTEKGGKAFFRTLANRAGMNVSEMVRTAVLHHAGLNLMPWPHDLAAAGDLDDRREIERALRHLQDKERDVPWYVYDQVAADPYHQTYTATLDQADATALYRFCLDVCKRIREEKAKPQSDPLTAETSVTISGRDMAVLRRMLANAEVTRDSIIIQQE